MELRVDREGKRLGGSSRRDERIDRHIDIAHACRQNGDRIEPSIICPGSSGTNRLKADGHANRLVAGDAADAEFTGATTFHRSVERGDRDQRRAIESAAAIRKPVSSVILHCGRQLGVVWAHFIGQHPHVSLDRVIVSSGVVAARVSHLSIGG